MKEYKPENIEKLEELIRGRKCKVSELLEELED